MAVPTAAYLVIVLGILVLGWGLATLIYFILRRRGIVPSLFASNSDFVRPAARPARFGFGGRNGFFAGGSPMGTGGGRGGLVAGGGRAPWQQFTQEWKPVLGEMPKLEERVLKEGGGEEEWKPINAQIQSPSSHPPSVYLSFLIALPSPPKSSNSDSSLTDLEFATTSLPLSHPSFAELLPLTTPLESLGPLEKVVNGVRMRREWVPVSRGGGRARGPVWL